MPRKKYRFRRIETSAAVDEMREKKRRLRQEMLSLFCCPRCGTGEPPFLDYFSLDLEIECGCGETGELRDFLEVER